MSPEEHAKVRRELDLGGKRFIIAYFGSPAPVRGLQTALQAVKEAARDAGLEDFVVNARTDVLIRDGHIAGLANSGRGSALFHHAEEFLPALARDGDVPHPGKRPADQVPGKAGEHLRARVCAGPGEIVAPAQAGDRRIFFHQFRQQQLVERRRS